MIRTGVENLDFLLDGGLKNSTITDIFGSSGTGKTQLALQIILNSMSENIKVLYQDTTGNFRPERLVEMAKFMHLEMNFLDKITVERITNVSEQQKSLDSIKDSDFSLIVIDNITDLFSFEYPKEEQITEKNMQFSQYMKNLSRITLEKNIPIVITNMIRKIDSFEQENMDSIISLYTHIKIKLTKNLTYYQGQIINPLLKNNFSYKITKQGLTQHP